MAHTPTVAFDFDGYIRFCKTGLGCTENILPPIAPGIKDAVGKLRESGYKVVVVSRRCNSEEGVKTVREYLKENGIEVEDVMTEIPASCLWLVPST